MLNLSVIAGDPLSLSLLTLTVCIIDTHPAAGNKSHRSCFAILFYLGSVVVFFCCCGFVLQQMFVCAAVLFIHTIS